MTTLQKHLISFVNAGLLSLLCGMTTILSVHAEEIGGTGEYSGIYNDRYIFPKEMATYCQMNAESAVQDVSLLIECVRKYISETKSDDTRTSQGGNEDYVLMLYRLMVDNMTQALNTSKNVADYEESQNAEALSRTEATTQMESNGGVTGSQGFALSVINDVIDTTTDYMKFTTFSRMNLIDPIVMNEDQEDETDEEGELHVGELDVNISAEVYEDEETVTLKPEDIVEVDVERKNNEFAVSDDCEVSPGTVVANGDTVNVSIGTITCEDGVLYYTSGASGSKTSANPMPISADNAEALLNMAADLQDAFNLDGDDLADNLSTLTDIGTDEEGVLSAAVDAVDEESVITNEDTDESTTDESATDENSEESEVSEENTENTDDNVDESTESIDKTTYSGVYKGRQFIPNEMADYCKMNAEELAKDVTQIENCIVKYVVHLNESDAGKQKEGRERYNTLILAMLTDLQAQAHTKQANVENFHKDLEEKYQKAADTSSDTHGDETAVAETEAFLTDSINALRELFVEKMKYESIAGIAAIQQETVEEASPDNPSLPKDEENTD